MGLVREAGVAAAVSTSRSTGRRTLTDRRVTIGWAKGPLAELVRWSE
jgi:hypothetical protein